jgi:RsiW-degrading membrane proteinase PrsW (M82 family)
MPAAHLMHWAIALLPVLFMLGLFIWLDVFKLVSLREALALLALGGVAALLAYPLSGRVLDALPMGFSTYSRFVAPWIEEALKGVAIVGLMRFNRIGYKLDAVISGFAIGAGFSVIENIFYLSRFPELGSSIWLVRGLGTAVMHGTTLAILAAIAHELAERETRESAGRFDFNLVWFVPGYLVAVGLHVLFNQFPDRPLLAMVGTLVVAPFLIMGIFHVGANEAQKWLREEQGGHAAMLAVLKSGRFPDDRSGRRVAALAERAGPDAAELIRAYWEVEAWLVLHAETVLLEQSSESALITAGDAREAFERRDSLRKELGPSILSALRPLLPFSRNDQWEVAELKQRLGPDSGSDAPVRS